MHSSKWRHKVKNENKNSKTWTELPGGVTPLVSKKVWLYISLWKREPTSHLIYQFPIRGYVSIVGFRSSSIQNDVHCGPIQSKLDDKAGYGLERGNPEIEVCITLCPLVQI